MYNGVPMGCGAPLPQGLCLADRSWGTSRIPLYKSSNDVNLSA